MDASADIVGLDVAVVCIDTTRTAIRSNRSVPPERVPPGASVTTTSRQARRLLAGGRSSTRPSRTTTSGLSPAERAARGKATRAAVPRESHAAFDPPRDRPDPVALLEDQNATREPGLVPVRHGRMMVSPFTFYRGAAKIMAADLKDTPTAGLNVQLCGDAHLSNFGLFASPERELLFDLNDFDETLPGPFEYDVKRMAASFTIAEESR